MYDVTKQSQRAYLAAVRIWGHSGRIPTIGQIRIDTDLVEMRVRGVDRLPTEDECPHHLAARARTRLIRTVRARPDEIPPEGPEQTAGPFA